MCYRFCRTNFVVSLHFPGHRFSSSTCLTGRAVRLFIQGASEFTYDMLSPGPSMRQKRRQKRSRRRTSNLPQDLREGVTNAYELVKEVRGDGNGTQSWQRRGGVLGWWGGRAWLYGTDYRGDLLIRRGYG